MSLINWKVEFKKSEHNDSKIMLVIGIIKTFLP